MKRKLAPEAGYQPNRHETDETVDGIAIAMAEAPKRLRNFDPDGKRGLALLKEIKEQAAK